MNIGESIKSVCAPVPTNCDFCDRNVVSCIEAVGFFKRQMRFVCKEHARMWHTGQLNL